VDVGDDMMVPIDAAKRVKAVGYLPEEDVELLVTVPAGHWDQFTNRADR
jgi:hypothetical protein